MPRAPRAAALACWFTAAAAGLALLPADVALRSLWLAPWAEEAVFRWGLQAPLAQRCGPRAALWITAVAFGLAHLASSPGGADAWRAAATVLPAAWIGGMFMRNGQLVPCVAWHAAFNLAWLCAQGP